MDLSMLNREQREVVETVEGPVLVLAGAGSGKTRALTNRVAFLIERGIPAGEILAITFTNKAAKEMRDRIDQLTNGQAKETWVYTFHACCARILRANIDKLGYNRAFSIYDDDDQMAVLKELNKKLNIDDKKLPLREVKSKISDAKNRLLTPGEWFNESAKDQRSEWIAEYYRLYEEKLKDSNALDFDDLLVRTLDLLTLHPPVLEAYRRRFSYIHVDEYQDTNYAQYMLVRMLAGERANLCVVGDDDQSIYGWRGADVRNILEFEHDFPNCKVIKLEQNYRSTANILDAANNVIAHNEGRKEKRLWTEDAAGDSIELHRAGDEREEAAWVCDQICKQVRNHTPLKAFAILYRMNAQARVMEEMLSRAGIAYRTVGSVRFYDHKEIRDIIAYLRAVVNPSDDISMRRIINTPRRSIGDATIAELVNTASEEHEPLFSAMLEPPMTLASRARKSIGEFCSLMNDLIVLHEALPLGEFIDKLVEMTGLEAQYEKEGTQEAAGRLENIREFVGGVHSFEEQSETPTLEAFLENVALITDIDRMDDTKDAVTLMTLHSAKGLEFDRVFMIGVEEGIFPSRMAEQEGRLEEERRLCYVGITRARKHLSISCTTQRMIFNQMQHNRPSRFIEEIPSRLINDSLNNQRRPIANPGLKTREQIQTERHNRINGENFGRSTAMLNIPGVTKGFVPSQARQFADQSARIALFQPGDRVLHRKFGEGDVVAVKGSGNQCRVVISFAAFGEREFEADMAPIVKIEH